jgi:hypothetical protein
MDGYETKKSKKKYEKSSLSGVIAWECLLVGWLFRSRELRNLSGLNTHRRPSTVAIRS